jgi:hypothetical protein
MQVFKFKYESTRERKRERESKRERERSCLPSIQSGEDMASVSARRIIGARAQSRRIWFEFRYAALSGPGPQSKRI